MSSALISGFSEGIRLGAAFQTVIETSAQTIPTQISATWLNWIIFRFTAVLPTQYLLQINTFMFSFCGLKCCSRAVRGGGKYSASNVNYSCSKSLMLSFCLFPNLSGSGGPVPYRIYVDSGVVMLCLFALAPASPLISGAAFFYFLFSVPLLRWTMIFQYRPKFDMGGSRFPFIFDICISGMVVGQILLTAMMALKRAAGPAILAGISLVPIIVYRYMVRQRFLRAFSDAALLQTSLLVSFTILR